MQISDFCRSGRQLVGDIHMGLPESCHQLRHPCSRPWGNLATDWKASVPLTAEAVLPPRFEHGDGYGVRQIEAALAGNHR